MFNLAATLLAFAVAMLGFAALAWAAQRATETPAMRAARRRQARAMQRARYARQLQRARQFRRA